MMTKKTVKKSTKKPSAKQIAARKKFAAAAKARSKKAAPKTRKTSTGKRVRTEAAKKARRAKNTVEGYYPNPTNYFLEVGYSGKPCYFVKFIGLSCYASFDKNLAKRFDDLNVAKEIGLKVANALGKQVQIKK